MSPKRTIRRVLVLCALLLLAAMLIITLLLGAASAACDTGSGGDGAPVSGGGIPGALADLYNEIGKAERVPPTLLAAIGDIETGHGANKNVSSAGAQGLMQFMPGTWPGYKCTPGGDPWNDRDAICAAARYLKELYRIAQQKGYKGEAAIAAMACGYNAGPGGIGKGYCEGRYGRNGEGFVQIAKSYGWQVSELPGSPDGADVTAGGGNAAAGAPSCPADDAGLGPIGPTGPAPTLGNGLHYPAAIHGVNGGGPEAHALRAWGDWQSDNAVDINIPQGTALYAVADGVVIRLGGRWNGGAGNPDGWNLTLREPNGREWFYTHLRWRKPLRIGQRLKGGEFVGASGAAAGVPHLHIGVMRPWNPVELLKV